jgi:acyl carrier protein
MFVTRTKQEIMDEVLSLLTQLASDWEFEGEIRAETRLFADLGFQSLDAVVLGNSLQERLGRSIPYGELLTEIGRRPINDVTVGEWVDFTWRHLQDRSPGATL